MDGVNNTKSLNEYRAPINFIKQIIQAVYAHNCLNYFSFLGTLSDLLKNIALLFLAEPL